MSIDNQLLRIHNVTAGYDGRPIVHDVNLDVERDSFIGMIGPNGGGKTTILRVLLGQLKPMSGTVERADGLRIGYLPQTQQIDLKFPINILDVVMSGEQHGRLLNRHREARDEARQLLSFAQLDHVSHKAIGELSGGQRQRAFLCRALMSRPNLLVLDEPVTYMDKVAETNLYKLLPELSQRMAIVLVSHDIGTISSVVKTIACVNRTLHYHATNRISDEMLSVYECPVEILSHGTVPHRVLLNHKRML